MVESILEGIELAFTRNAEVWIAGGIDPCTGLYRVDMEVDGWYVAEVQGAWLAL